MAEQRWSVGEMAHDAPPPTDDDAPWAPPRNGQHPTRASPQQPQGPTRGGIKLWTIEDLETMRPPTWRINGILPDGGLSIIFGPPSTYKSFVALAWSLCIASGYPWLGHDVDPGAVIYVAAEGGPGLRKRIRAWQVTNSEADPHKRFRAVPHRIDLRSLDQIEDLKASLRELVETLEERVALIIIDTWSRNTPGAKENSSEDMGAAIGRLDDLREEFGCGVLIVHHSGLEGGRERGSTSVPGAMEARWETKGQPNASMVTLTCHKLKEWDVADPIPLSRHVVGEGDGASLILKSAVAPCANHMEVIKALDGTGELTQKVLLGMLTGSKPARVAKAKEAAECPNCPVRMTQQSKTTIYWREDQMPL